MSEPLAIPPPKEILEQIEARRAEINELKKLLKVSVAATRAQEARKRQRPVRELAGGPTDA